MQSTSYKVDESYKGQRNILVPTRMYSRNAFLNAMHIKSDRYLGVNLDRYVLTFHSDKDATSRDPKEEIPFSHIKSLEADVTKADSSKYYLKVHTDDGDLKFKFNNPRDFHSVVEALRNTIHNDKPFYSATDSYSTHAKNYSDKPTTSQRDTMNANVSSDDEREYHNIDRQKGLHHNQDFREDPRYNATLDKQGNRDEYKYNKDVIKDTYAANKDKVDEQYKVNKDIDKDLAKDQYRYQKAELKDQRDAAMDYNREQYKANKDDIKNYEHTKNDAAYQYGKKNVKKDANDLGDNLKDDYELYKGGTRVEKEIAKDSAKQHVTEGTGNIRSDVQGARNIREGRY